MFSAEAELKIFVQIHPLPPNHRLPPPVRSALVLHIHVGTRMWIRDWLFVRDDINLSHDFTIQFLHIRPILSACRMMLSDINTLWWFFMWWNQPNKHPPPAPISLPVFSSIMAHNEIFIPDDDEKIRYYFLRFCLLNRCFALCRLKAQFVTF